MKYKNFSYLLFLCFLLFGFDATAQTTAGDDTLNTVLNFIQKWGVFVLALWEVIIRYIPTAQSLSFITLIIRIIEFLVPDTKAVINGSEVQSFGAHGANTRTLLNAGIAKGDKVKTKSGKVVEIQKFVNGGAAIMTTDQKQIPINDVIEVVKTTYTLINAIKSLVTFIKGIFSKKPTTI